MNRTTFRNASGLPHRGQLSTARDMGTLARALIRDFPGYYPYFSTEEFDYRGDTHLNHNKLLTTYDGVDGLKTGYIRASGFNLVASARRGGQRVIGVIFGGNSPNSRNALMTRLLNLGFKALNKDSGPVYASAKKPSRTAEARTKLESRNVVRAGKETSTAAPKKAPRLDPVPKNRRWGIQVGAFARYSQAYEAARRAIEIAPSLLMEGTIKVVPLKKRNGRTLHRARIKGISQTQALRACDFLKKRDAQCMKISMRDDYRVAFNDR